jgi:hypothetical protein
MTDAREITVEEIAEAEWAWDNCFSDDALDVYKETFPRIFALARRALSQAGGEELKWKKRMLDQLNTDSDRPFSERVYELLGQSPSVSVEREIASETEWRRGSEVERQVIYRDGTIETEFAPDTPQSVPTCTCSKHPLWDGYDGDCPIHGWFEPVAPDTPQSIPAAGDDELAVRAERDRLQDEINTILEIKDKQVNALVERVSVLEKALRPFAECMNYLQLTQEVFNNARDALRTSEGVK